MLGEPWVHRNDPPPPDPKPCWVDLTILFPPLPEERRRLIAHGIDVTGRAKGTLKRWEQATDGAWIGRVDYCIPNIEGKPFLWLHDQLVPACALTPRRSG